MRRVLIIAYYFPPLGGIGSQRVGGFARYLPEYGWEPTVLAPRGGAYYRDPSLAFPEERVIRSRSLEISRAAKRVLRAGGDDVSPAKPGTLRRRLQAAARRVLYYPDAQVGWYLPTVVAGRKTMREDGFDAIFSSAYPITAHLIARRLHRDTGVPWVAEYRDPWTELLGAEPSRRQLRLEHSIAREASGLVMTSPSWASSHAAKWQRSITVITNGCEGAIRSSPSDSNRFVLTHLGTLYPQRHNLMGTWRAIRRLDDEPGRVDSVRFIGELPSAVRHELSELGLASKVEETGFLARPEAIERLSASSALLLAGPRDGRDALRGWIPAKLFEYLATDLPIIYVGHQRSDAASLLRDHDGCYILGSDDVDGIAAALRACRGHRYSRDVSSFTRPALTGTLAGVLDEASRAEMRSALAGSSG